MISIWTRLLQMIIVGMMLVTPGCVEKTQQEEITFSNYPRLFENDVIIVTGVNASNVEIGGAEAIANNLSGLGGNMPVIKTDAEITEKEKAGYNLVLVGRPDSNNMLREAYEATNATKVTNEFPGAGKGILEILRNPWNEDKVMLLVAGSDENGLIAAFSAYNKSLTSVNGSVGYTEAEKDKLVQLIKLNQSAETLSEAEETAKNYFFETSERYRPPNARYYTKGYEFDSYFIVEIREIYFGINDTFRKFYRIEKVKKS